MTDTIPVPRAWLERLIELNHKAACPMDGQIVDITYSELLIGHITKLKLHKLLTNGEKEGE